MQQEIEEIIKKNLPAHVGETLKKRLEEASIAEAGLVEYKKLVETKNRRIDELNLKVLEYEKNDARNADLDKREKVISDRERNAEIIDLKNRLSCEQEKTIFCKEVAMGLVRNTEYRSNVFCNTDVPAKDQYGNAITIQTSSNNSETKEAH